MKSIKLSYHQPKMTLLISTLAVIVTQGLSTESVAETLEYRVAYVEVSASDQIRAGDACQLELR